MKVYVSSTYEDLKDFRRAVKDAIIDKQHLPIMMEHIIPEGNPPKAECLERVGECDVFIGIYAYRYGYIPEGDDASISEQEYEKSKEKNKRRYCFILHTDIEKEWPDQYKDDNPKLKKFRSKILTENYVKFFKSTDELKYLVAQALPFETLETRFERALDDAQSMSKAIDAGIKLKLIDRLIEANESGIIKDEALKLTTKLIVSDFSSFYPNTSYEFIHYAKNFLNSHIRLHDFIEVANLHTRRWRIRNQIRKLFVPFLIFFLAGILIGKLLF